MKRFLAPIVTTFAILALSCLAHASSKNGSVQKCLEQAKTQTDMNECAYHELTDQRRDLDDLLARIKKEYVASSEKSKKLEAAQKAWVAYADAQIDLLYSEPEGSVSGMCQALDLTELTQQRIEQIKKWRQQDEGYVCGGL